MSPADRRQLARDLAELDEESRPRGRVVLGAKLQGKRRLALVFLASLAGTATTQDAMAADPPVFSPNAQTAWVGIGIGAFLPVPGQPTPVGQDPAHPYISNDESGVNGVASVSAMSGGLS